MFNIGKHGVVKRRFKQIGKDMQAKKTAGVKDLLRAQGITIQAVADKLQVSKATVSLALDEDMRSQVRETALNMIKEKNSQVAAALNL